MTATPFHAYYTARILDRIGEIASDIDVTSAFYRKIGVKIRITIKVTA